jgi:sugar phosphate isomerase/epimerase
VFETIKNAWKIADLKKKLLFTVFVLVLYRVGSAIPIPYMDSNQLSLYMSATGGSIFQYLNIITGSAFSNATLFALGINPYITASIVMQLLCIAIPYLGDEDRPGQPGFATVLRVIAKFGALCKAAGIQLLYHNHDFEFEKVSGMYALDFMYEAIDEEILKTEIDTCWVNYSGVNPAEYVRKYTGRAPIVHMKDFVGSRGGAQPYALIKEDGTDDGKNSAETTFEFRPVGHGCQDVAAIIEAGLEAGAYCFVVEQDQWYNRTPLEAAAMSIETLKKYL